MRIFLDRKKKMMACIWEEMNKMVASADVRLELQCSPSRYMKDAHVVTVNGS